MDNNVHKDIEPGVINNELLIKAIDEQGPKGEAGRLAREEGREMNEIKSLRIEFLNILRIDHLWMLDGLTKLSLSSNIIEKIQNLDNLIHLKELDLSFNKIEVIENLDNLVNLEVLTFYSNLISSIGNMDTLKKLHIFSIGKNKIEEKENIYYLRKFKKLKSVNMAGNPCAEDKQFRIFIGTFLPQIDYYEYVRISSEERENGLATYSETLKEVIESEKTILKQEAQEEAEKLEAELNAESFVEFLGGRQLFDVLFEKDPDGQAFLSMKDDVEEFYLEYEENFLATTKKLFEVGQEQYKIRREEVQQFFHCVNTAKEDNQKKSQEVMERFLEVKGEIFSTIKEMQENFEFSPEIEMFEYTDRMQSYYEDYSDLLHDTWKELMGLELTLFDQLEEANLTFERTVTEMVNQFVEEAQGLFTICRGLEVTYFEHVSDAANKLSALFTIGDESVTYPDQMRPLLEDKELLNNALATSHDVHMQLIDSREDRLVNRAKQWLDSLATGLQRDEVVRNRSKVLEINHFLDIQREEFDDLQTSPIGPLLNPDVSAALS